MAAASVQYYFMAAKMANPVLEQRQNETTDVSRDPHGLCFVLWVGGLESLVIVYLQNREITQHLTQGRNIDILVYQSRSTICRATFFDTKASLII